MLIQFTKKRYGGGLDIRRSALISGWIPDYIKNGRISCLTKLLIQFAEKRYGGGVDSWRSVLISGWIPDFIKNGRISCLTKLLIQFAEKRYGGGLDSWRSVGLEKQQQYSETWRPKPEITWRNQDQNLGKYNSI